MNTIIINIRGEIILFQGEKTYNELYHEARKRFSVDSLAESTIWFPIEFHGGICIVPPTIK